MRASPDSPPQVLYVEDHPVNVQLMQALFAQRPELELTVATTGQAGFEAAIRRTPDLLLLDLNLPDCHGTELLERLRAEPALSDVPAIAVTAADVTHLDETTFLELWPKPLDIFAILQRLDQLLLPQRGATGTVSEHLAHGAGQPSYQRPLNSMQAWLEAAHR